VNLRVSATMTTLDTLAAAAKANSGNTRQKAMHNVKSLLRRVFMGTSSTLFKTPNPCHFPAFVDESLSQGRYNPPAFAQIKATRVPEEKT